MTRILEKYSQFVIGFRTGSLIIIDEQINKWNQSCFLLKCDCGGTSLIIRPQILKQQGVGCKKCTGGKNSVKSIRTHGKSETRLYSIWKDMVNRCYNSKTKVFHHYGGRGISVTKNWKNDFLSFETWANGNGYLECLTIDRINNDGNYEPNNCRWATMKQQLNNRRGNVFIEVDGIRKTKSEWSDCTGIPYDTIRWRLRLGWSAEKAIKTPYCKK